MSMAKVVKEDGWLYIKLLQETTPKELPDEIFPIIIAALSQKERFRLLVDATAVKNPPFGLLMCLAKFIRVHRPAFNQYLIGSALITPSKVVKALLTALFHIQTPVAPNIVCNTIAEGQKFLSCRS